MNLRKSILAGLMCLIPFAPCKAQKAVHFASNTGIAGKINSKASCLCGMDVIISKNKNYTDLFGGVVIQPDKTPTVALRGVNNYSWTKNLSSWVREACMISGHSTTSTLEVAPIRANANWGPFNFSLCPAYTVYNNFTERTMTQGINTIFQTTYSMTKNDKLIGEAKYMSTPAKNIFNTRFESLKNNTSYMIVYMHHF